MGVAAGSSEARDTRVNSISFLFQVVAMQLHNLGALKIQTKQALFCLCNNNCEMTRSQKQLKASFTPPRDSSAASPAVYLLEGLG